MGTSNWDKFRLLMWKNWKIQWNHKIQLLFELFLPAIFSLYLVLLRYLNDPKCFEKPTVFNEFPINLDNLRAINENDSLSPVGRWEIAYSPQNVFLEKIVLSAVYNLNLTSEDNIHTAVVGTNNSKDLKKYLLASKSLAGIQFDDNLVNTTEYPKKLVYSIRFPSEIRKSKKNFVTNWLTSWLFPPDFGGPRNRYSNTGGPPEYIDEGFAAVQNALSMGFIDVVAQMSGRKKIEYPEIIMQRMPFPPHLFDPLIKSLEGFVPLIIVVSFVYPASQTVKYITAEKEMQLKEVMKIMGLPNWLHWTAWFIKTFILISIAVTIIGILLKWQVNTGVSVLTHTNITVLLFFLYVYTIATITFCFMISTLFSKANTAASVAGIIWFIAYIPFQFKVKKYQELELSQKLGLSLISNTGIGFGFKLIMQLEGKGEGLHWYNLFRPVNVDDNISVGTIMIMMLIAAVIYMLIALYIEKIYPGNFGISEKWYFPFTKDFWQKSNPKLSAVENGFDNEIRKDDSCFEPDPNKHVGLAIRHLTKVFHEKVAVNNLTMNLHEDEITVLLGHNGAGKTTTISMLTGMFPPTAGTAIVNGYDIRTDLGGARASLGICPQHNILFDELTVRDHIVFYSRLKGLDAKQIENEVKKFVNILQLKPKINTLSKKLSGGMKRKLSVGAALCGGSKVVLLDEPSSGMDPAARRSLWDLIQAEKQNRTILLSTHFMDEADVLGDRIAIMSAGELQCFGTSFFLKKRFGCGYHLIFVKNSNCDAKLITNLLRQYIPDIQIESEIGTELSYQLPDKYSSFFEDMLSRIEDQSDDLNLDGYGISITTLEEVFMKVGAEKHDLGKINLSAANGDPDAEALLNNDEIGENIKLLKGWRLFWSQWKAMLFKKFIYTIRNYIILIVQNFMPIFFVIVTILANRSLDPFKELPSRKITSKDYYSTVSVLETNSSDLSLKISNEYQEYENSFGSSYTTEIVKSNISKYLIDYGQTNLVSFNSKYLKGATIMDDVIIAWFNNHPFHTVPLALNAIHNAIARHFNGKNYSIEVTNDPLPYSAETRLNTSKAGSEIGFLMSLNLSLCMSFVSAFYILFLIKERESRAKLLQFVSGVRILLFWFGHFIGDMASFLVTSLICLITLACFQPEGYGTFAELGRTFLILILFGFAVLPLTYLFSMLFKDPPTGFSRMSTFNIFTGMALFYVVHIMKFGLDLEDVARICNYVFLILPHYSLATGLMNLNTIVTTTNACNKMCEYLEENTVPFCSVEALCKFGINDCCVADYFQWEDPGILANITYFLATFHICFFILLIREFRLLDDLIYKLRMKIIPPPTTNTFLSPDVDEDVKQEQNRIKSLSASELKQENLILYGVTKYYGKFLAANNLFAGIRHSECFGLLGVNGAGKTTTFKMMTGDERITYGAAFVKGMNLKNEMNQVYRRIGYCPQFDALLEDLTGRELLRIFSLLRGIPENRINQITNNMAKALGYTKHLDKPAKTYSGGNKRKLSTSIALLGNPSVIYLDEPTAGMDPGARRQLWNLICRIRDAGKSIVLTSHSMEECEALCTRLVIMVNGEFKCIGSTQHLKNKYYKGLVLRIKLKRQSNPQTPELVDVEVIQNNNNTTNLRIRRNTSTFSKLEEVENQDVPENVESVRNFILTKFPDAILQEQYLGILTFYIPLASIKWSSIFGLMERNKEQLNIEDYSISQTTLEQIFLDFAKKQHEDKRSNQ